MAASDLSGVSIDTNRLPTVTNTLNDFEELSSNHAFGHPDISYSEGRLNDVHSEERTSNTKSNVYKLFEILNSSSDDRKHKLYNYVNTPDTVRMPMIYKIIEPINTVEDYKKYSVSLIRDKTFNNKGSYDDAVKYDDMFLNPIFTSGYNTAVIGQGV